MRKGKLQQSVLVRSVFKMLGQKREDAAGPAVGRGVSAFAGEKETQVFSCAPVLVKDPEDAVLAVCRVCNSVAAAGAAAKGVLVSLMLPEAMEEKDLKELMRAVDGACVRYGTAVIGGHTEVTDGVLYPVLTVTAAGGTTRAGANAIPRFTGMPVAFISSPSLQRSRGIAAFSYCITRIQK